MRRQRYDEDLFKDSTMTFGEHLEELRVCLWKAIMGLAIGFIIGLYFGGDVVDFIQMPLKEALKDYLEDKSLRETQARLKELRDAGYPLPEDPDEAEQFVEKVASGKTFQEVYVSPSEVVRQLQGAYPDLRLPKENPAAKEGSDGLVRLFLWHKSEDDVRVTSLSAHEPFMIYVKASLLVGALTSSPWVFYQIWAFVAAGLYPHEKHYVHVFLPFSLILFFAGAALAFFFVFGPVLQFLFYFNESLGIEQDIRISEWLGFVLLLPLGFGVSFQLPLVMLFLERIGIFTVASYVSKWRISVMVIFVVSAVLTPADPYSLLLMAGPLTVLYFGGILLCKYMPRKRSPFAEPED